MFILIGLAVTVVMVFGGYALAGGKIGIVLKAMPFELMIIGGAGVGTFLMANDAVVLRRTVADLVMALKGPRWKKDDYAAMLCLLFELLRLARTDPLGLETHIENPNESELFRNYPSVLADDFAVRLLCDYLRTASMNFDDPHQVDEIMERDLEAHKEEALRPSQALQTMADALPALGIVAAVLGVIKTMAHVDQPPPVLGKMIGAALVGTFLGVFLAYCVAGPLAARIRAIHEDDHRFYNMIRDVLVAHLHRHAPNVCVEIGRKNVPGPIRPTFYEVERALTALRARAVKAAA